MPRQTRAATRALSQNNNTSENSSATSSTENKVADIMENVDPLAAFQDKPGDAVIGIGNAAKIDDAKVLKDSSTHKKKKGKKGGRKNKKDKAGVVVFEVAHDVQAQVDALSGEDVPARETAAIIREQDVVENAEHIGDVTSPTETDVPRTEIIQTAADSTTVAELEHASLQDVSATEASDANSCEPREEDSARQLEVESALAALEGRSVQTASSSDILGDSTVLAAPRTVDPIEEIDALEDALEELGKSLPNVPLSPEKTLRKQRKPAPASITNSSFAPSLAGTAKTAKVPNVTTKPATAAKVPRGTSSLTKTTQRSAASRVNTARPSQPSRTMSSTTAINKRHSTALSKEADRSGVTSKPTDYLASKRRPISMQFPPPPSIAKSTKAPTRPTFTLPGDAISARKKALLEEKLRKEEEELQRRRSFKPRPVPESIRVRPSSMIVKQNASSRARLSIIAGGDGAGLDRTGSASPANTGLKRSNTTMTSSRTPTIKTSATFQSRMSAKEMSTKASANTAVKRDTSNKPALSAANASKRSSMMQLRQASTTATTGATPAVKPASARPKSMLVTSSHRPSTGVKPSSTEALALRAKAKSIYNRDCNGGEVLQRERREKEEAAKRARAQAAEKGRQASREWAEKQRKKLMDAKALHQQKTAVVA